MYVYSVGDRTNLSFPGLKPSSDTAVILPKVIVSCSSCKECVLVRKFLFGEGKPQKSSHARAQTIYKTDLRFRATYFLCEPHCTSQCSRSSHSWAKRAIRNAAKVLQPQNIHCLFGQFLMSRAVCSGALINSPGEENLLPIFCSVRQQPPPHLCPETVSYASRDSLWHHSCHAGLLWLPCHVPSDASRYMETWMTLSNLSPLPSKPLEAAGSKE